MRGLLLMPTGRTIVQYGYIGKTAYLQLKRTEVTTNETFLSSFNSSNHGNIFVISLSLYLYESRQARGDTSYLPWPGDPKVIDFGTNR